MRTFVANAVFAAVSGLMTVGAVAFASPANATTGADRIVVHTSDLDMNSDAGRTVAERRVRVAIEEACDGDASRDLRVLQCRSTFQASAKQALNQYATAL